MRAHAHDLRAEVEKEMDLTPQAADAFVHHLVRDWRSASLDRADRALCAYAQKLTERPTEIGPEDVEGLRCCGFDDRAIHDGVQVVGFFNYINRVADGLGVDLEDQALVRPWEQG